MHIIDEENVDSKKPHQTGFFRDGKRRIDLVLVCKDIPKESAEQIKLDYLINAMSSGLQLEIETGMSEKYRHLMFIKVHSPEYLIRHFGYYYNMRKYFKESHLNYANNNISDEVNMVKVMRKRFFKTDAYPIDDGYSDIPCWEREYNLHPVTQDFFMHKMNSIFFMLCEGTFFICIFPLEAFIIFLFAVFEIRSWAKELIVHSRRPLIPQRWGLSLWKYVLLFMPFAAAFINSLTWVRHTHYLDRQMNDRYFRWVPERRFFADHYMGFFDFNDLTLTYEEDIDANGTRPDFCMFPGQYNRHIVGGPGDRKAQPMSYMPQAGKWYIHWHQALVVLIYLMMTVVAGLLITHLIEKVSEDTQVTMELEETLKQFHVGREPGEADDYLKPKKEMAQEMPKKEMAQDMPKPKGPKPKEQ